MNLSLGLRLYATDLTACQRCGNGVRLQESVRASDGFRICFGCVAEYAEQRQLAQAANRPLPS